jgi:hypothetical protein
MKETKTLARINTVLFYITAFVGLGGSLLLVFGYNYYDASWIVLLGALLAFVAYVQKLVISVFINNSNNLAAIKEMLENRK